jgi:prepilin signal peptidase PulO-like enzyme (type II secretory pathway)
MLYIILGVIGLALGSFVNALVWRIHEQDEQKEKKSSKKRDMYLKELSITKGRSMCPYCHHQLAAKDLIPVVSWVSLGGKCRYCRHKIDDSPLVEVITAALFILSYVYWPLAFHGAGLVEFIVWLPLLVGFMALAVYDLRWYLLPNRIVYPLCVLVAIQVLVVSLFFSGGWHTLVGSMWGIVIGGGIFYVLFQVSQGKWIGGGDVKLGALLGALLGGPLGSLLLLFVASVCGTFVSVPLMASGKVKRTTIIPFGPFLLFAAILIRLFGSSVVHYLQQRAILP